MNFQNGGCSPKSISDTFLLFHLEHRTIPQRWDVTSKSCTLGTVYVGKLPSHFASQLEFKLIETFVTTERLQPSPQKAAWFVRQNCHAFPTVTVNVERACVLPSVPCWREWSKESHGQDSCLFWLSVCCIGFGDQSIPNSDSTQLGTKFLQVILPWSLW